MSEVAIALLLCCLPRPGPAPVWGHAFDDVFADIRRLEALGSRLTAATTPC